MNISRELALIINLKEAADWHKKNCNDSCNVSLTQLKWAADFIFNYMKITSFNLDELKRAAALIDEWPVI